MTGEHEPLLSGSYDRVDDAIDKMDQVVRNGFIRKVYSILSIQLITTFVIAYPFSTTKMQAFVQQSPWLLWLTLALNFVFLIVLTCCPSVGRKYPANYLLLGGFTATEGALLGVITAAYDPTTVLLAISLTAGIVISLTIYAMKTDADWTGAGPYLFVACICLLLFGLLAMFFPWMKTVYSACGALLFSFYLVYDTQIIVGGKHKQFQLSVDEYVFAALALYLDIVNLFLYILQLLGNDR